MCNRPVVVSDHAYIIRNDLAMGFERTIRAGCINIQQSEDTVRIATFDQVIMDVVFTVPCGEPGGLNDIDGNGEFSRRRKEASHAALRGPGEKRRFDDSQPAAAGFTKRP